MDAVTQITQILGIKPGTDISGAAIRVAEHIKVYAEAVEKNASHETEKLEQSAIQKIYEVFLHYTKIWEVDEKNKNANKTTKEDSSVTVLKGKASKVRGDLEGNIASYIQCYLRLYRSVGFVHKEIGDFKDGQMVVDGSIEKIPWTSDTGVLLDKYRKERTILTESNTNLRQALEILKDAEAQYEAAEAAAIDAIGNSKTEKNLQSCRSALRVGDFSKARKILEDLKSYKPGFTQDKSKFNDSIASAVQNLSGYIDALESNISVLLDQSGKTFLGQKEVNLLLSSQEQEIEQKNKFIEKYHQSYIENKLKELQHLKDKLFVIGTLNAILNVYTQLVRGITEPLDDMKAIRDFESNVVENVNYLLGSQFQEIEVIERRHAETMAEFEINIADYKKFNQAA